MSDRRTRTYGQVVLILALSGCAPPLVGVEPQLSSAERNELQRAMSRPQLEAEDAYQTVAREIDVPVTLAAFSAWFQQSEVRGLQSFSTGTASVARLERVEALTGTWSRAGDRRRAVFADGNTAVQELVDVGPQGVEYVEWNLTNDAGRYLRHVRHRIELTARGPSTHVRWVSAFRPRPFPDGLLIRSYVRDDYAEYLRTTLTALRQRAVDDFASASTATTSR